MADEFAEIITSAGGSIKSVNTGGFVPLHIGSKNRKGHYIMLNMETGPEALKEYERIMGLNEDVLRFLNIKIEEFEDGPSIMMQANLNGHSAADAMVVVTKNITQIMPATLIASPTKKLRNNQ